MKCIICGKEFHNRLPKEDVCDKCRHKAFLKKFWAEALDDKAIIIDKNCYHLGSKGGFGGTKFKIRMLNTNEIVVADGNLWHQGEIPDEYYKGDNAEFIN